MTDVQIFQAFSLVYLAIGAGILINSDFYKKAFADFTDSGGVMYLGGVMALVVGYLLVAFHNTWTCDVSVIITVLGWIALIKGIVILVAPKAMAALAKVIIEKTIFMKVQALLALALGLFFSYVGFCPKSPLL